MSRPDVLVDADWVEAHKNDPGVAIVEVDEDTSAYDTGHIPNAIKIDWKQDLQDPVRRDFVDKAGFEALLSERGIARRRHGGAVRRQQQLVRRVCLLVLQAVRAPEREAARRRPQEVGARLPRAGQGRPGPAHDVLHRPGAGRGDPGACATRWWRRSASATWSTCARPTSSPAGCSPRRTCRRSRPSAAGTSRPRRTCRGPRRPTTTARSSPTTSCAPCTATRPGWTSAKDTIAYCRIGERSAHTWFVLHELLDQPNVKNYDGSWTEYGSLVGRPDRGRGRPSEQRRVRRTGRRRGPARGRWQPGGGAGPGDPRRRRGAGRLRPAAQRRRRVRRRGAARRRTAGSASSPPPAPGPSGCSRPAGSALTASVTAEIGQVSRGRGRRLRSTYAR